MTAPTMNSTAMGHFSGTVLLRKTLMQLHSKTAGSGLEGKSILIKFKGTSMNLIFGRETIRNPVQRSQIPNMKIFSAFVAFGLIVLSSAAQTPPLLNSGPLNIKLLATAQGLENATTSKTNSSAKATTVTTVSKSTVSNSVIQTTDFLKLLENTFSTSLPSGSQFVIGRTGEFYHLAVVDSTGTNSVLDLSTNVFMGSIFGEQPAHAGMQTLISKTGNAGDSVSGNLAETVTQTVVLGYDDSGVATQDGTHTKFEVTFLVVRKTSQNLVTQQIKDTLKFSPGVGSGIVRDQNVLLQGTVSATVTGVLNRPPT